MTREIDTEELEIGESAEISPGVVVERRCFFKTVALAFGALALPGMAKLGYTPSPTAWA